MVWAKRNPSDCKALLARHLYPISFVLPKETGYPQRKALLLVRWNLMLAEILYVVIPKQDT